MNDQHSKTIFLVEDDEDIRVIIERILEMKSYKVVAVTNGEEALAKLATGFVPDLILLDLMMPIMDGAEFRKQQREKYPHLTKIPLLVMSADGQIQEKLKTFEATGYIKKPMDLDTFLELIKTHVDA